MPRSLPMKLCSSSTTTARVDLKRDGIDEPRFTNMASSDSGVMTRTPRGSRRALSLTDWGTSPCHGVTGVPAAIPSSRSAWSEMRARSGETHRMSKPPSAEGSSITCERSGMKAASVFPPAVVAARMRSPSPSITSGMARS